MGEIEIPLELITEILIRLPVKPLSRFKCVSKSWKTLISSPDFISHHFKSNPNLKLVTMSRDFQLNSALIPDIDYNDDDNNGNLYFSELNHPLKLDPASLNANTNAYIIDSCNGILLISTAERKAMFLCNPANNTYRLLPPIPTHRYRHRQVFESIGLGYDSHTDNYKVIRVFRGYGGNLEIYVYSMRENVWKFNKDKSVSVPKLLLDQVHGVGVAVDGVLCFMARAMEMELKRMLMCFDVRTELFSIRDYPELDSYDFKNVLYTLSKLHGSLCIVVNYKQLPYVDVWEMKEVSWVKLFRIRKSEFRKANPFYNLRLIAYSKDKRKLFVEVDDTRLLLYDLATKRVKKVKTHKGKDKFSPHMVITYVESLVSVSM